MTWQHLLPLIFLGLMGFALLVYVVLDGFDLGVGLLLRLTREDAERDTMIASIGPFWDANETWLVLGVGLLLVAFPHAQGEVLGRLYLPVAVMLIGLILRGVAFDFRVKAQDSHKPLWNNAFFVGSLVASLAQGWMLGRYITAFNESAAALGFAWLIALALPAAYLLLGAGWLLWKTEGALQMRAAGWARASLPPVIAGVLAISLSTPIVSPAIFERWFSLPEFIGLLPVPLATAAAFIALWQLLKKPERVTGHLCWLPFMLTMMLIVLAFLGLAYSIYPWIIIDRIDVWHAAASTEALVVLLIGAGITIPAILAYTVFVYRVFRGKTRGLSYG
jgi:cytochrome d ubiquinol oxidase subunit II